MEASQLLRRVCEGKEECVGVLIPYVWHREKGRESEREKGRERGNEIGRE